MQPKSWNVSLTTNKFTKPTYWFGKLMTNVHDIVYCHPGNKCLYVHIMPTKVCKCYTKKWKVDINACMYCQQW